MEGATCRVCEAEFSECFEIHRGVNQGSVLSPILFLIVMDLLLQQLSLASINSTLVALHMLMILAQVNRPWRNR